MGGWDGFSRREVLRGVGTGALAAVLGVRPGRALGEVQPVGVREGGAFCSARRGGEG